MSDQISDTEKSEATTDAYVMKKFPPLPSGNDPALLGEIKGWNWGACSLTWIWLFAFDMPLWGMLVLAISCIIPGGALIASTILGFMGNELAWRNKRFENLDAFRKSIKDWNYAGILFLVASIVIFVVGTSIALYYYLKVMKDVFPNGF